jgi:eukaryotic-like serine/threonine-protein kinase
MADSFEPGSEFNGYKIHSQIGAGTSGRVYKAEKSGQLYALKILSKDGKTQNFDSERFSRESTLAARFNHPNLLKTYNFGLHDGIPFLVMELVEGTDLRQHLQTRKLSTIEITELGLALASALTSAHSMGITHRDIKPENILISADKKIKLIDFGLAGDLDQTEQKKAGNEVVGSGIYAPPEQLGFIDGITDERSDLYSLGILLFEASTGQLPLKAKELVEIFGYFERAIIPAAKDIDPLVSPSLSMIITKAMQVEPKNRYQSSQGLIHDLQNVPIFDSTIFQKGTIVLGAKDFKVTNKNELAGREDELAAVLKNLNLALTGSGRGIALEGDPGVGKSRLAKEVINEAKSKNKIALSGKCSFQEKDNALSVIRKVLGNLISQLHSSPDAERLKQHVAKASIGFEQILVGLNPEFMNYILDKNYGTADIDTGTLLNGLSVFLSEFAKLENGIVILIDDIQWADQDSTLLVHTIFKSMDRLPVLFLFTARSDVNSAADAKSFYKTVNSQLLVQYAIKPLKDESCLAIIRNHLGNFQVAQNLAQKLIEFSSGNPFLLIENINRLSSSGLLYLQDQVWNVSEQHLNSLGLSDNVFELILGNIKSMPIETFQMIQNFAAYGSNSSVENLSTLTNKTMESIMKCLEIARKTGCIERLDNDNYQFSHDRIKEALLTTLSETERKTTYTLFARNRFSHLNENDSSHFLDLARFALNSDIDANREFVFECLYLAGRRSNQDFAFNQAVNFLGKTYDLIAKIQIPDSQKWLALNEYAFSLIESGNVDRALEVIEGLLPLSKTTDELVKVKTLKLAAFQSQGKAVAIWDLGLEIMDEHNIRIPKSRLLLVLGLLGSVISFFLMKLKKGGHRRISDPVEYEKNLRLAVVINRVILNGLFITPDKLPSVYLMFKYHQIAQTLRPSIELIKAKGWIVVAFALFGEKFRKVTFNELEEMRHAAEELKTKAAIAFADYYRVLVLEAMGEIVQAERQWILLLESYGNYLVSLDYSVMWVNLTFHYLYRGDSQTALDTIAKFSPRSLNENRRSATQMQRYLKILGFVALGKFQDAQPIYDEAAEKIKEFETGFIYHQTHFIGLSLFIALEKGQYTPDVEEQIQRYYSYNYKLSHAFNYAVIGYLRLLQIESQQDPAQKKNEIDRLKSEMEFLRKKMKNGQCDVHLAVLDAALARYRADDKAAAAHLERGQRLAAQYHTEYGRFMLACEEARLSRDQNNEKGKEFFARKALEIAQKNRWNQRIALLRKAFSLPEKELNAVDASQADAGIYNERLVRSLLNISMHSSMELDPEKQINHSLDEIISVMKAERSFVFLKDPNTGQIVFSGGRDFNKQSVSNATAYSTTVVKKVYETQTPMVVIENEQMEALGSQSAVLHGLRSILAAPLVLKGECNGVLYVDSSLSKCVFSNKDLDILSAIAMQIAISFENVKMIKDEIHKKEIEKDLELTAKVQSFLLPRENYVSTGQFEMSGFAKPAVQCGGDWWWYHKEEAGRSLFFVGDVTGHGAGPAMLTSYVSACFDSNLKNFKKIDFDRLLPDLNDLLLNLTNGEFLMSSIAFEIDYAKKELSIWNCASPGMFVMQGDSPVSHICEMSSLLGVADFEFSKTSIPIGPGDRLFITTDGFTEMSTPTGEALGTRRVMRLFQGTRKKPVQESMSLITQELEKIQGKKLQEDDITMVYVEVK